MSDRHHKKDTATAWRVCNSP